MPCGSGAAAGHHHRVGRHLAARDDLAGLAVDDRRRGVEEDAHRDHRALAHDHALGHLRAGADEAVVLDDGRVGLQRLQHPADADAAGKVHALADLGAGADRGPGVDHGPLVDIGADVHERGHQHHVPARRRRRGARSRPARRESRPPRTAAHPSPRTWRGPCPTRARAAAAPPSAPARITRFGLRRNDSSTACLAHCAGLPAAVRAAARRRAACRRRAGRCVSSTAVRDRPLGGRARRRRAPPRPPRSRSAGRRA